MQYKLELDIVSLNLICLCMVEVWMHLVDQTK
jgi:hypothetical protein